MKLKMAVGEAYLTAYSKCLGTKNDAQESLIRRVVWLFFLDGMNTEVNLPSIIIQCLRYVFNLTFRVSTARLWSLSG